MKDWKDNPELDLWRLLYKFNEIEIRKVAEDWISLGVTTESQ